MITVRWTKPVHHYHIWKTWWKRIACFYTLDQIHHLMWWQEHHLIIGGHLWITWRGRSGGL